MLAGAAFALLCAEGCAGFFRPLPHDTRYARTGNAEYWASLHNGTNPSYHSFQFGNDQAPYDGRPLFFIQLPDGQTVRSDMLSAQSLHPLLKGIIDANEKEPNYKTRWPPGSQLLSAPPFAVVVHANKVLLISFTLSNVACVSVAKAKVGPFYRGPLNQTQATEVFGCIGADKISDYCLDIP